MDNNKQNECCNSNIVNNAIKEINKNKCCCQRYIRGQADTITIAETLTGDPGCDALVNEKKVGNNHILSFVIPRGEIGPTGPSGFGIRILGTYNNLNDLIREHPTGNVGDGYMVGDSLYIWSDNQGTWANVGQIKGDKGDRGEPGPEKIGAAYLVSFNTNYPVDGYEIFEDERLPIQRKELDTDNIITLENDNVIKFNKIGHYKVTFTAYVTVPYFNGSYDPNVDFVSIGFRQSNTDNIYIGSSCLIKKEETTQILGQGIIAVNSTSDLYELINLSKRTIYLNTPDITNIKSNSYFTNAPITILIEYLGR